ncbi:unnamed protein product [Rotaria magnacalcarata]
MMPTSYTTCNNNNSQATIIYVSYEGCCYEVRIRSDSDARILDILYGLQRALCIPQHEMMLCFGQQRIDCHQFCSLRSLADKINKLCLRRQEKKIRICVRLRRKKVEVERKMNKQRTYNRQQQQQQQ